MLELEHGFHIVDADVRLDARPGTATRRTEVAPERLERELHQAGVVTAVVAPPFQPTEEGYLRANNAVARMSVERPFLPIARLDGPRDPRGTPAARLRNLTASRAGHHAAPDDVERFGYDGRFHGFYLDPARDGLPDAETLDSLAETDLPVVVRGGVEFPPAAAIETLVRRGMTVVLAGFGGFPLDRELMRTAIESLDTHDSLYVDTSWVRYRAVLERALTEHPDRVLFGSGAPAVHPNVGVMEVLTLDVPEDLMRRAFRKNPARVFSALDDA